MKDEYVKSRTAKLLKEKGFYEENIYCYYQNDSTEVLRGECKFNWNIYDDSYSAPTQEIACRWLMEEKNIYITAVPDIGNSLRFYPAIYVIKGELQEEYWVEYINSVVEELNKSYDKPQQAIEAALEFVLTKLI